MKTKIIASIVLVMLLFANTERICSEPIVIHQGRNFITVEFQNETFKSINELSIYLDVDKSTPGIQMEPLQTSLSESNPVSEITFPITVQGIQDGQEALADFIVTDNYNRIWTFKITFRIEEKSFLTYDLKPNFPNPFNSETEIHYVNAKKGKVTLNIYNQNGQLVRTLIDKQQLPGSYQVKWDGDDEHGQPVAPGIYYYQLKTDEFSQSRNMLLIK